LFVLGLLGLSVVALFFPIARIFLAIYIGVYGLVTLGFGILEALRKRDLGLVVGFPIALWTMHLSWGTAFFVGTLRWIFGRLRGGT
jgi:hypothetical protein